MIELGAATLYHGKCLDVLATLPENSVDSIVCDPPYGLSFMGKKWDYQVPPVAEWQAALRVLKPGGYLLAFSGSRTYHRMVVNIEDAGFEIRDQIMWVYGSGFPKSLDVSKAIDRTLGAEREKVAPRSVIGHQRNIGNHRPYMDDPNHMTDSDEPVTAAAAFHGYGTALKPAHEPIVVARKPLDGTVASNVLTWGVGGLNIDGCRVATDDVIAITSNQNIRGAAFKSDNSERERDTVYTPSQLGRFPANLIHDGSDEVLGCFPNAPGQIADASTSTETRKNQNTYGNMHCGNDGAKVRGDSGSAARFFYCAKASRSDRGDGNKHPTVKPRSLMRYLCRLVTPPGGTVLDHYGGSGSTVLAALDEGFKPILIEQEAEFIDTCCIRIANHLWRI